MKGHATVPKLSAWSRVAVVLSIAAGAAWLPRAALAETRIVNVPYTCAGKGAELDVTLEAPAQALPGTTITVVWSVTNGLPNAGETPAAPGTEIGSYGRLRLDGAIRGELAPMTGRSALTASIDPGQPIAVPPMTGYMTIPTNLPTGSSVTIMPGDFQLELPGTGKITCVTEIAQGTKLQVTAASSPSPSPTPSLTPTPTPSPSATPTPSPSPSASPSPSPSPRTTVTVSVTEEPQVMLTPLGGAATGEESPAQRSALGLFLIVFGTASAALIGCLIWRRA
ncbi:hypothetical protein [Acrocarpospora catenulata]|uniref:hypothetical protein n=1 Tax=Acrocarpospora catenulata TaxID=2836182 RepID=UPI001BDAB0ED|nr:hypothetical protein [Acrocarpospora catenulata]